MNGTMMRLWAHECMRVFHDRLIDAHDLDASCIDKLERPAFFTTYLGPAPEEDTP